LPEFSVHKIARHVQYLILIRRYGYKKAARVKNKCFSADSPVTP